MLVKWSVQQDFELVSLFLVHCASRTGRRKGNPKGVDETPLSPSDREWAIEPKLQIVSSIQKKTSDRILKQKQKEIFNQMWGSGAKEQ